MQVNVLAGQLPPTSPIGATGRLAIWLSGLTFDDVPAEVLDRAKDLLLDGIGCALVGAQLPWSRTAAEAVMGFEGAGDAPIIGWGRTIGRPAAALLNGTFIQGFELDDVHIRGPLHSASVVIPAILSAAVGNPCTGRAALLAAVAGFEVGPRVGMSLHGAQMLSRGWHSGSVFGTHAAAAATGVLAGLSPAQMEDALGLAGTQSGGLMAAQFEAMSKRMHHGFAARAGYTAAMLARAGYTGIKRVFERDYGGFLAVFGEGHDPDPTQIDRGLGETWETMGISLKPYAAMGACHGPLDALFDVQARSPFRPEDVDRIDIHLSHAHYHHGWWDAERPLEPIGAQMHIGYSLAAATIDGAAMARQYAPDRIDRDDIWALMPKIHAHHEPAFDGDAMAQMRSRLVVRFVDGRQEEVDLAISRTYDRPMPRERVIAKFRALTDGIVEQARRDAIERFILGLDTEPAMQPLFDLLAPAVGCTFDR